jgi:hypothetical protein
VFLGQINLADIARYPYCSILPSVGVLTFFYDPEQETWGFHPKDRASWLVHFEPDAALLHRCAYPESALAPAAHLASPLTPSEVQTLPAADSPAIADLGLTSEELDEYSQVLERIEEQTPHGAEDQLLGQCLADPGRHAARVPTGIKGSTAMTRVVTRTRARMRCAQVQAGGAS